MVASFHLLLPKHCQMKWHWSEGAPGYNEKVCYEEEEVVAVERLQGGHGSSTCCCHHEIHEDEHDNAGSSEKAVAHTYRCMCHLLRH